MSIWKDINKDAWSFTSDMVSGYGGGIGRYQISYAINIGKDIALNGKIAAEIKIDESPLSGAGLVCRADERWTFLALYVVATKTETPTTSLMIGACKEGIFDVLAILKEENLALDDDFNLFSLQFFSGHIKGEVNTSQKSYVLECLAPQIPFPGYMGLVKFYGCGITAKNIEIEKMDYSHITSGKGNMKKYKYDVFISHSSKDQPLVEQIVEDLRAAGITYWVDSEQITFGDPITGKIEEGLRESKNVLVCMSLNLGQSNWCRAEYGPVLNRELRNKPSSRKVLPLKLDNCGDDDIPMLLYDRKSAEYSNPEEYNELLRFLKS